MGGGGVQRWLKMSKYIHAFGWNPVVYTAAPETYLAEDKSLLQEVRPEIEIIRTPILEPYGIYAKLTGQKKEKSSYSGFIKDKKPGLIDSFSLFVRSNFFIPDARKFWIKPSVKFLRKWLEENKVEAIITNGPPHSVHMIGLGIKKYFPDLPWIADFRDPWTNIDFYSDLKLMRFADRLHHKMEKRVLSTADKVVTVTWNWQSELSALGEGRPVDLILNGYDPEDFESFQNITTDKFIICHLGSMNKDRNPESLWQAISELVKDEKEFSEKLEIHLIGPVDRSIHTSLEQQGLTKYIVALDFIPHREAMQYLQKCNLLLLPINKSKNSMGILPGKMYEYIATGKPVLSIGPLDGDIAKVLNRLNQTKLLSYENRLGIKEFISTVFRDPPEPSRCLRNRDRWQESSWLATDIRA